MAVGEPCKDSMMTGGVAAVRGAGVDVASAENAVDVGRGGLVEARVGSIRDVLGGVLQAATVTAKISHPIRFRLIV